MRYRYVVTREDDKNRFVISELSRRSEDNYDPTGQAEFSREALEAAAADGADALLAVIRSDKMYPPAPVAVDLAARIMEMLKGKGADQTEAAVDEIDVEVAERKPVEVAESEEEEEAEIDDEEFEDKDLLEEDDMGEGIGRIRVQDEEEAEDITDTDI